jgi:hypothetical protein
MNEQVEIEYLLTVNTEQAETNIVKLESGLIRLGSQIRRISGNEQLDAFITKSNQAISAARSIQTAIRLTSLALASSGPVGWLLMGTAVIGAGLTTYDFLTQSQM